MKILNFLFGKHEISQSEIDAEIEIIKEEQKYRRMYITPPPLLMWSKPILDKEGYVKSMGIIETNQEDIDRWKREHYDWLKKEKYNLDDIKTYIEIGGSESYVIGKNVALDKSISIIKEGGE